MINTVQTTILKWLARYKYLNINQIHHHFFRGKTKRNTEICLQRLEQQEYIHRISFPRSPNFNFGMICYLSKQGYAYLEAEAHFERQSFYTQPVKKPISSPNHYYHKMRCTDFFIALDLSLIQFSQLHLKKVLVESRQVNIEGKGVVETNFMEGDNGVIADMAFVVANENGKEAVWMVEIDTAKEVIGGSMERVPTGSLLHKYQQYEYLLQRDIWKNRLETDTQAFQVLTVTETDQHLNSIMKKCGQNLKFPQIFLGSTHEKMTDINVLSGKVWKLFSNDQALLSLL